MLKLISIATEIMLIVRSLCSVAYYSSVASSKNEFSKECDLVLPLSISSILFFSLRSPSSCVHHLHLPAISVLSSIFPSIMCFRRQFLCKMWPIELAFLLVIVLGYSSPPWLFVTLHFSHLMVQMIICILLQYHISKLSRHFWSTFWSVQFSAQYSKMLIVLHDLIHCLKCYAFDFSVVYIQSISTIFTKNHRLKWFIIPMF